MQHNELSDENAGKLIMQILTRWPVCKFHLNFKLKCQHPGGTSQEAWSCHYLYKEQMMTAIKYSGEIPIVGLCNFVFEL